MSRLIPITYQWDSEANAMIPKVHDAALARRQFKHGADYRLAVREERSPESLGHYMATLKDIHDNLDDAHREEYPTPQHLRKRALIKLGYRHVVDFPCESEKEAKLMKDRLAKFIKADDEYAVIVRSGSVVRKMTAMSQSRDGEMDRQTFEESKRQVLDLAAGLVGASRKEAERNGSKGT